MHKHKQWVSEGFNHKHVTMDIKEICKNAKSSNKSHIFTVKVSSKLKSDKYNNVKVSELEKKIESIDIPQRTTNLIFTKLSEPQIETGENYVTEEKRLVQGVLNKLELESIDFDICGRIVIKRNDTRRPFRIRGKK